MRQTALAFLYVAAIVGGSYSAFRPMFDSAFARSQAETGDGMFNHYLLEHSWRAISDPAYCGSLVSPPFYHPAPHVYWYSETLLGVAPLYWGLRLVMPYDLAYQWWQIVCSGLNFLAFALVARWLRCGHLTTILGAYFWAFSAVLVHHGIHQQLIPRFWMPIAVYHTWHLAAAPSLRSLNRTLGFAFLQAVTCVYTGWFLAVALLVFAITVICLKPDGWKVIRGFLRAKWRHVALVSGLWGLAFGGFFLPYLLANSGVRRDYAECIFYLPTVAAWLKGPPGIWWDAAFSPFLPPLQDESCLFAGFAFTLLALVAAVHLWRSREARARSPRLLLAAACLVTAAVWSLLTLNIYEGVSAWWVVRFVPGGGAIRCVSRVNFIVNLFAVLGVILWLDMVAAHIRSARLRVVVLAAVTAAVIFEQAGFTPRSFAKEEFYPEAKRYAERIRGCDAAFVVPQRDREPLFTNVLAMWAGLEANVPIVNGYSGRTPPGYPYDYSFHSETYSDDILRGWLTGQFRGRVAILDPADPDHVRFLQID